MKKTFCFLPALLLYATMLPAQNRRPNEPRQNVPLDSIVLSDPFILADAKTKLYYMTGTGGMLWKSADLKLWNGPYRVARTDSTSWMGRNPAIWAAEIHAYKGKYYYFANPSSWSCFINVCV